MANNYIVTNSKFTPFSYKDLIAPMAAYQQAYDIQEEKLQTLSEEADLWEKLANEKSDSEAYKTYENFRKDLDNITSELANSGLNPGIRKDFINLKNRYTKDIKPIGARYDKRAEIIKEQRDKASDGVFFDINYSDLTLDQMKDHMTGNYQTFDSNAMTEKVASEALPLSTELRGEPELIPVEGENGPYLRYKQNFGFSEADVITASTKDQKDLTTAEAQRLAPLYQIKDKMRTAYNYDKQSDAVKKRMDEAFDRGLFASIGTPKDELMNNPNYIDAGKRRSLALQEKEVKLREKALNVELNAPGGDKEFVKYPSEYTPAGEEWFIVKKGDRTYAIDKNKNIKGVINKETGLIENSPESNMTLAAMKESEYTNVLKGLTSYNQIESQLQPMYPVIKYNGKYSLQNFYKDFDKAIGGFTVKSDLVTKRGNPKPDATGAKDSYSYVEDWSSIPGFNNISSIINIEDANSVNGASTDSVKEYIKSAISDDSAFGNIIKAIQKSEGIDMNSEGAANRLYNALLSGKYRIFSVKRKKDTDSDYVVFRQK